MTVSIDGGYIYEEGELEYIINGDGVYEYEDDDDDGDREYNIENVKLVVELAIGVTYVSGTSSIQEPIITNGGKTLTWNNLPTSMPLVDISFDVKPTVIGANIPINTINSEVTLTLREFDDDDCEGQYTHDIYLNMNVNPTSSSQNNRLEIHDTDGSIYSLYKQGKDKGLIDRYENITPIPHSGYATQIIFREKGNDNVVRINGRDYNIPNRFKRYTIIANDINNPIEYTVSQESPGAGKFYIELNATNARMYVESGNKIYVIEINDNGKIEFDEKDDEWDRDYLVMMSNDPSFPGDIPWEGYTFIFTLYLHSFS